MLLSSSQILLAQQTNANIFRQNSGKRDFTDVSPKEEFYRFNAGIGLSFLSDVALSLGTSFSYQRRNNIFSVRYINNEEFPEIPLFGSTTPSGTSPKEKIWDCGVLYGLAVLGPLSYGRATKEKAWLVSTDNSGKHKKALISSSWA